MKKPQLVCRATKLRVRNFLTGGERFFPETFVPTLSPVHISPAKLWTMENTAEKIENVMSNILSELNCEGHNRKFSLILKK